MAIYNATKMAAGTQPKVLPTGAGVNVLSTIALTTALLLNDTINFMQLGADATDPNGFGPTILDFEFDTDQLDSNVAPTLKLNLGDSVSAFRYLSQTTLCQTGGVTGPVRSGTVGFQPFAAAFNVYTTPSLALYTISATVQTAPATWQNGSIRVFFSYTYDP